MLLFHDGFLRSKVFWILIFAVLFAVFLLIWQLAAKPRIVRYHNFNRSGVPMLLVGAQAGDRFSFFTYSMETISLPHVDIRINDMTITPRLIGTEGDSRVFSFKVIDDFVVREFPEVRYSGEETLTVARGADWYIQFIWM